MPIPNWNKLVAEGRAVAVGVPLSDEAIRIPAPAPISPIPKLEKPVVKESLTTEPQDVSKVEETAKESEPQDVSKENAPVSKEELKTSEMIAELKKLGIKTKFGAKKEEIASQYAEAVANAS